MGVFSSQQTPPWKPQVYEHNNHFGMSFRTAIERCSVLMDLQVMIGDYEDACGKLSSGEYDAYTVRKEELQAVEDMNDFAKDARTSAEESIARFYGRGHPDFERLVEEKTNADVELERSIRMGIEAAVRADTRRMNLEFDRHRELVRSIENVAHTVEKSSAYAQAKKLNERHPFLTAIVGPSLVRKIFGR